LEDVLSIDGKRLLLASQTGGVWLATDDGQSPPVPLGDGWSKPDIHSLCAGSKGPRHFYAAGEEGSRDVLKYVSDSEENWPSSILERSELEKLLAEAIRKMPYVERTVLSLYYHEELTLREIAKVVDLHESRISQLKTQAILRLRTYMGKRWPTAHGACATKAVTARGA
jgi:hypothetical protein